MSQTSWVFGDVENFFSILVIESGWISPKGGKLKQSNYYGSCPFFNLFGKIEIGTPKNTMK